MLGAILGVLLLLLSQPTIAAGRDQAISLRQMQGDLAITLYRESDRGIPQYVQGELATGVRRGDELNATISFFTTYRDAYLMRQPSTELKFKRLDVDRLGMRHLRLQQVYNGVPVYGVELLSHFTADDRLQTINGEYLPDINIATIPGIDDAYAVEQASADLKNLTGLFRLERPAELVIFPLGNNVHLVWRFYLNCDTPLGHWEYFIDAGTGEIIYKANRIMSSAEIGTGLSVLGFPRTHIDSDFDGSIYRLIDNTRQSSNNVHSHNGQMPSGNAVITYEADMSLPGTIATDISRLAL